jgi:hypothetical protein
MNDFMCLTAYFHEFHSEILLSLWFSKRPSHQNLDCISSSKESTSTSDHVRSFPSNCFCIGQQKCRWQDVGSWVLAEWWTDGTFQTICEEGMHLYQFLDYLATVKVYCYYATCCLKQWFMRPWPGKYFSL